jgi:hypothetical protein
MSDERRQDKADGPNQDDEQAAALENPAVPVKDWIPHPVSDWAEWMDRPEPSYFSDRSDAEQDAILAELSEEDTRRFVTWDEDAGPDAELKHFRVKLASPRAGYTTDLRIVSASPEAAGRRALRWQADTDKQIREAPGAWPGWGEVDDAWYVSEIREVGSDVPLYSAPADSDAS